MKLLLATLATLAIGCGQLQPSGKRGKNGIQGEEGPRGIHGLKGESGIVGPRGFSGSDGSKGDRGVEGATGPQGRTGNQGSIGERGATGPRGKDGGGVSCTISRTESTNRIQCEGNVIEWPRIPLVSICHFEYRDNQKWCKQINNCPVTDAMADHFGHSTDFLGKCTSNCKRF